MQLFRLIPLLVLPAALTVLGCNNEDDCLASDRDIDAYLDEENLRDEAQEADRGLFYIIEEPGDSARPTLQSVVTVNYEGTTTNGEVFDQTTGSPISFELQRLITGWQIGIPLIGAGGRIRLFIPAELAYGPNAVGQLCPNSDLIFDVELVRFE